MQRRGGTGRTGMKTRDEDFVEHLSLLRLTVHSDFH